MPARGEYGCGPADAAAPLKVLREQDASRKKLRRGELKEEPTQKPPAEVDESETGSPKVTERARKGPLLLCP
jgi:hypothetical protein